MLLLILSVSFGVIEVSLLKLFKKYNFSVLYTIVYSYVPSLLCCFLILEPNVEAVLEALRSFGPVLVLLGALLVSIFMVMVKSVEKSGIAITVISQRLSLSVPVLYSVLVFHEHLDFIGTLGIILAFIALLLVMPLNKNKTSQRDKKAWLYPALLFVGMGLIDILYGSIAKLPDLSFNDTLIVGFFVASILSPFLVKIFDKNPDYGIKSFIGGLILGIVNFCAIYFFTSALKHFSNTIAIVYMTQAIGIVTLASLVGIIFFKERLKLHNVVGLLIAVVAIWLLISFKTAASH